MRHNVLRRSLPVRLRASEAGAPTSKKACRTSFEWIGWDRYIALLADPCLVFAFGGASRSDMG